MNGVLLFLLLVVAAYFALLYYLRRTGRIGTTFQMAGPLLLWKTQRGKPTIEKIARARRFWLAFGDFGVVLTMVAGLAMLALLVLELVTFLSSPRLIAQSSPEPLLLIGLPGINPLIPLWYGIIGLLVALVIHEGCHAILSRAQDIRVKSLGVLFFALPIGAFVEPDEKDLEAASVRNKNRMFAAGPTSNLVMAAIAGLLFSSVMLAGVSVANGGDGVGIGNTVSGYPAYDAGLRAGDIITGIDGFAIHDLASFNNVMNQTTAGQTITVHYLRAGATADARVTLADKGDYLHQQNPAATEAQLAPFRNKGFLGVSSADLGTGGAGTLTVGGLLGSLQHPFSHGLSGFITYIQYPFVVLVGGIDLFQAPYSHFIDFHNPIYALSPALYFVVVNILYWIFWLNLMLGTFNAIPAGPLDGGQMFRATLRGRLMKWYRVDEGKVLLEPRPEGLPGFEVRGADLDTQDKLLRINRVVRGASMTLGLFVLFMILLPVLAKPLAGLFG